MTQIVSHRGARNLWPENSLTGFRNTVELDVGAVEFDVHLTDAGELVVIHDATLERTTNGNGPVRLLTPASRASTVVVGTDEPVPTLEDVLTVLAARPGLGLHVELKADEQGRPYPALASRIAEVLERFGVDNRSHLTSFSTEVLEECRRLAPELPRLVSVNADWAARQGGMQQFLAKVRKLVDIVAVEHTLLAAEWTNITAEMPRERLCAWTVNDPELIADFLRHGVGFLTSDRPDLALAQQAAMAS